MKNIIFIINLIFIVMMVNCSGTIDITKDFAMVLNGNEYRISLARPVGRVQEIESGFSVTNNFSIMFPTKSMNRFQIMGFEFFFEPQAITPGEVITSTANDENYALRLIYTPPLGIRVNEEAMLVYSSRSENGSIKARFDILEPELGGRVKGVILEAVLYGFYDSNRDISTKKPATVQKLEIYNFVFDTKFENSIF
ncbi:MAG: hypothetical protein MUF15_22590 [Acidobacteria bacterium]|nr:hypothetical protein [Acidobacteriota bacterium]